jgi:protein PhnA
MTIEQTVRTRSANHCELCGATETLTLYFVAKNNNNSIDNRQQNCAEQNIMVCPSCLEQINNPDRMDVNHWRCLNDSMWNQEPVVQVMAWRMLTRLKAEGWPQELLDRLYLEDETLAWAQASNLEFVEENTEVLSHKDCNGITLTSGDTVIITKDLNIKGSSFTAKRGTAVRGISLVADNAAHIEGRINGQQIIILTQFVKKSN